MADPLNLEGIEGLDKGRTDICTIEASCVTGFEAIQQRGRVVFDIDVARVNKVSELRCVNTVWVMLGHSEDIQYPDTEESQMDVLRNFVNSSLDWRKGLNVWRKYTGF